eukprot:315560-Pleurochrysis_carterae.AAC.1
MDQANAHLFALTPTSGSLWVQQQTRSQVQRGESLLSATSNTHHSPTPKPDVLPFIALQRMEMLSPVFATVSVLTPCLDTGHIVA